jgi:hypothetical protein
MPRPYCFHLLAEPTAASPQAHDIGGAWVNIWVMDDSLATAETRARAYLMDYAWVVKEIEYKLEPTPDQIAKLDAVEHKNYEKALRQGISAIFSAWPKVQGKEGDPVELRPMGPPPLSGSDSK